MSRTKGAKDIAPRVRQGFLCALAAREVKPGKSLTDLIDKAIEEEGILKVLDTMAKFTTKEVALDANVRTIEDFVLATVQEQQTIEHDSSDRLQ